jgi:D-glycero-D-manno-heptose 1,7-bisphosphate phosphatase
MQGVFFPPGIWLSKAGHASSGARGGLFLDRDGVLVEERNYLSRPQDVVLRPDAVALLSRAQVQGLAIVVATNQSGIDRGLLDWTAFEAVEAEIARQLAIHALSVDLTIACSFHPEFPLSGLSADDIAYWRKPGPGMLELALRHLDLTPAATVMVGDKASDIEAARSAGLTRAFLLQSRHYPLETSKARELATSTFRVSMVDDLSTVLQTKDWSSS